MERALADALGAPISIKPRLLDVALLPGRAVAPGGCFVLLDLLAVEGAAVLELELPFICQVVARLAGARPKASPVGELTRMESAALGYLTLVALQGARRCTPLERAFSPRLHTVGTQKQEAVHHLDDGRHTVVEVTIRVGDDEGRARLILPGARLQTAAESRPREDWPAPAAQVMAARVEVRCFLDAGQVPSKDMDDLSPGDVVAIPGVRWEEGEVRGTARVHLLGSALHGELSKEGFTGAVHGRPLSPEPRMTHTIPAAALLPVDVEVELARVQLPLNDLACLQSGMVLPLRMSASDPVLLRVGDRAVARAELVDLEGEVGARILTLLTP
jgi:type III secretion protein Q